MNRVLIVDFERCVGCRVCEGICAFTHYRTHSRGLSAITVTAFDEISTDVPVVCVQCEDAPCQAACPTKSIYRNESTGAYLVNRETCIGCRSCVFACPFGAMFFHEEEHVPIKCDLCSGEPECVRICPSEALRYEPLTRAMLEKRRETVSRLGEILGSALRGTT
jgi:carbon-monoxide dehydrogenase iron sulfur subunit